MSLFDFYSKAKKKLYDTFEPVEQKVSSGLGRMAQSAKNYLNSPAPKWMQSTIGRLPDANKTFAPVDNFLSNINTRPLSSRANSTVGKIAGGIVETPYTFLTAVPKFYGQTRKEILSGDLFKPGGVKRTAGRALEAGLDTAGMGLFSKAKGVYQGVKPLVNARTIEMVAPAIKAAAKEGMKVGAKYGAGYGAAEGLKENDKPLEIVKKSASGAATGAVAGGVLGGGIASLGALKKAATHDFGLRKGKKFGQPDILPERTVETNKRPAYSGNGYYYTPKKLPAQEINPNIPLMGKTLGQVADALPNPGLTIKDTSKIAAKRAKAKEIVAKQISNQKTGAAKAEPGFVAPQAVKKPDFPDIKDFLKGSPAPKKIEPPFKGNIPFEKEFPGPSAKDKKMAKALGLPEEKIPFNTNYNRWQKEAYNKAGERIKSIGEVVKYPRELTAGGFTKKQIEMMGPKDAATRAELLKLGYPKEVVAKMDAVSAKGLLDNNVAADKVPEHILNRYMKNNQDNARRYVKEDIQKAAGEAQYAAETNKKEFNDIFDRWIGERNSAKTSGMELGAKYKEIPKELGWDVIESLEHPDERAPENVKFIGGMIREQLDRIHETAGQMGMKVGYWWDYFPHIWKESPEQIQEMIKGAGGKFKFANAREIPTYREGINMGLTPKYNHPAPVLAEYMQSLKKTEANLKLLNGLKNKGFVVDAVVAQGQPGFSPIIGQGFPKSTSLGPDGEKIIGDYYAPTDIANKINQIFSPVDNGIPGEALSFGAKASGVLQDLTLSGGIPKTPINAWTFAQTTKEVLSGRIKSPILSLFRAASNKFSNKFFEGNSGQIKKMQELGIPMENSWNIASLMDEGFVKNAFTGIEDGAWNATKSAWHKTVNEPTFKRFMPMLQINLFNDIERKAIEAGRSANEASQIAAKAVRNFYGVTSAGASARRSKLGKDIAGTFLFAPRYRESMINFWVNNVKAFSPVTMEKGAKWYKPELGLTNPLSKTNRLENGTNLKFLAGATLLYGMFDAANYALTGRRMKDNPKGKEDKLLIPVGDGRVIGVPFLSSIATMPRMAYRVGKDLAGGDFEQAGKDFSQGTLSMGVKPLFDVWSNEDYFGNEIYDKNGEPSEKFKATANYLFKQYGLAHPYLKTLASTETGNEILNKIGLGVDNFKPKPGYQLLSEAIESPLRFYDQDKIASGEFWDKKTEAELTHNKFRELAKTDEGRANEYYAQHKEMIDAYPQLNDMAGMYSKLKKQGLKDEFGGITKNLGFGLIQNARAEGNTDLKETPGMSSGASGILRNFEIEKKKEELKNSDQNFMDLGDTVLRKAEDGTVHQMRKTSFQASILQQRLESQKRNEDLKGWFITAETKLKLMGEMLNDPSIDELDKMTIQNDIDTLNASYQKYKGYNGFLKGRKAAKLEEKFRYPLVDPDFVKIQSLLLGLGSKKPILSRRAPTLVRRRLPVVRRSRRRR